MKNHDMVDWSVRVLEAKVSYKGTHLSCCGIGAIQGFMCDGAPDAEELECVYDDAHQYFEYVLHMQKTPEAARTYTGDGLPDDIETPEDYAEWKVERETERFKNAPTLAAACQSLAYDLNEWSSGQFQQIVFSGCVSEFVPRTEGEGTYSTPFHAGTLAAWIEKEKYGDLWSGPVSHNDNHGSMVQTWIWVPPWVADEAEYASTYENCDAAELEETIYG